MIGYDLLKVVAPMCKTPERFVPALEAAATAADATEGKRLAWFLAQVSHETGDFRWFRELASGRDYEWRHDLGNIHAGDGVKYRGRGMIMITGRSNYAQVAEALGIDCLTHPELLEEPHWAGQSAAWFWNQRDLNAQVDVGDSRRLCQLINGGMNGYADRCDRYRRTIRAMVNE